MALESRVLKCTVYRPDLEKMLEDYWRLMPEYQSVNLDQLQPLRILFGFFPTYRQDSMCSPNYLLALIFVLKTIASFLQLLMLTIINSPEWCCTHSNCLDSHSTHFEFWHIFWAWFQNHVMFLSSCTLVWLMWHGPQSWCSASPPARRLSVSKQSCCWHTQKLPDAGYLVENFACWLIAWYFIAGTRLYSHSLTESFRLEMQVAFRVHSLLEALGHFQDICHAWKLLSLTPSRQAFQAPTLAANSFARGGLHSRVAEGSRASTYQLQF